MQSSDARKQITPQYVLSLTEPTDGYLCSLQDNAYGVEFVYFKIRNYQTNDTLVQIKKKPEQIGKKGSQNSRKIRYNFGPYFFMLKTIGTTLKFRVGSQAVKDFKMIQRHYFKKKLIKSYEFDAPFCMPNSTNEMQAIYELPNFNEQQIQEMIENPWETISDSFYFVGNKLIMHTKAQFSYAAADYDY